MKHYKTINSFSFCFAFDPKPFSQVLSNNEYKFIKNNGQLYDVQGTQLTDQKYYFTEGNIGTFIKRSGVDMVFTKYDQAASVETASSDISLRITMQFHQSNQYSTIAASDSSDFIFNHYIEGDTAGILNTRIETHQNILSIQIIDLAGRTIAQFPGNNLKLDLSTIESTGIYIIQFTCEDGQIIKKKIVKE